MPTQDLKKELLPSLKKGLQRIAAQEDPVFKYAMRLKERDASLTDEEAYSEAERILSEEGIPRVRTEDDDEEAKAWRALASSTVSKVFGPSAAVEFQKEYDAQIKDVTQPQGGTENLTNVRGPGQPPAKIPAEPGRSSTRNYPSSTYEAADGKKRDVDSGAQTGFTYDVSPGSPSGGSGRKNPNYRLNEQASGPSHLSHGPDTGRVATYQATKPGDVRPSYSGVGPRPRVPSRELPEGGSSEYSTTRNQPSYPDIDTSVTAKTLGSTGNHVFGSATDRREAEHVMGKAFLKALDEADANGPHPMDFDLRRAGMGTVKEVVPDVVSKSFLNKEMERFTKPTNLTTTQSTDTAADEEQFDYDHFKKVFELEKQASGMRRLARDQEIAGNFAGRDDLSYKALLLEREADEIRKQVHKSSLNRILRTVLSKPVK